MRDPGLKQPLEESGRPVTSAPGAESALNLSRKEPSTPHDGVPGGEASTKVRGAGVFPRGSRPRLAAAVARRLREGWRPTVPLTSCAHPASRARNRQGQEADDAWGRQGARVQLGAQTPGVRGKGPGEGVRRREGRKRGCGSGGERAGGLGRVWRALQGPAEGGVARLRRPGTTASDRGLGALKTPRLSPPGGEAPTRRRRGETGALQSCSNLCLLSSSKVASTFSGIFTTATYSMGINLLY
ncbi:uncharacterized protein LOC144579045 [Callithrix jacchus]